MYQYVFSYCDEQQWYWVAAWVYLTSSQKPEASIYHIENCKCDGDGEMNGKHLSRELEIFEATEEKITNIILLFSTLKLIIPPSSIE